MSNISQSTKPLDTSITPALNNYTRPPTYKEPLLHTTNTSAALTERTPTNTSTTNNNNNNVTAITVSGNRTVQTPVPVAESILRSIYGKASELTSNELPVAAWNVSQLFPVLPDADAAWNNVSQLFPYYTKPDTNFLVSPNRSVLEKKPTDPLTVQDLERILAEFGYVRPSNVSALTVRPNDIAGIGMPVSAQARPVASSQVAFPQPSVLSYTSLQWGITAAACLSFTVLASSVHPSLWLVGGLVGSLYGYAIGQRLSDRVPTTFFPSFLVVAGRRLATWYLQVYDFFNVTFFMYKTGQLSYSMWRRYAEVDKRFQIQDKIDAWNAVFVEGKESFDRWEKENEIGRKTLAALRTIWLVEERSWKKKGLKRRRKRSRYRLVQIIYDCAYYCAFFVGRAIRFLSGGGTSTELSEFLKGIRVDISAARLDSIGSRLGAIVAALIAINITGALYTISPFLVMTLTIMASAIWPTWLSELFDRCKTLAEETRARGRGEEEPRQSTGTARTVDKSRYHFYVTKDGRKRYYRVAPTPFFGWPRQPDTNQKGFRWPWQKPVEPKRSPFWNFLPPTPPPR